MYTLKVLLADDHDSFRRIFSAFLKAQQGIEIVGEAANGQEVVEKAKHLHPDLILMDVHMPLQNGIEATKMIKNHLPSTKVFILSMDISEFCQKNAHECADGFIAKSSIKNALLSVLAYEQQLHREAMTAKAFAA
jgi:two-component system nitrate/nitrite response regulator NarL